MHGPKGSGEDDLVAATFEEMSSLESLLMVATEASSKESETTSDVDPGTCAARELLSEDANAVVGTN